MKNLEHKCFEVRKILFVLCTNRGTPRCSVALGGSVVGVEIGQVGRVRPYRSFILRAVGSHLMVLIRKVALPGLHF